MSLPLKAQKLIHNILLEEARKGSTTKAGATALAMRKMEMAGGPEKFGIGPAAMLCCLRTMVGTEVGRQLKQAVDPESVAGWRHPPPVEVDRLPNWIALAEGANAPWRPSLKASEDDWKCNGKMKGHKASTTQMQADLSLDIARYLKKHGYANLEEATI